jgi:hypothetical protein
MYRRDVLKTLVSLPVIPFSAVAVDADYSRRQSNAQPWPTTTLVGRVRGVTAITRVWANGDEKRCSLCRQCEVSNGVCNVLTTRTVNDDDAEMFSCPEI